MDNQGTKLTLLYTYADEKMRYFKRDTYEQAFTKYCAVCDDIYKEIDEDTKDMNDEDLNSYIDSLASSFVEIFCTEFNQITKKGKKLSYITGHNAPLVVYLFPAIMNYDAKWSKTFCECVVTKWNEAFNVPGVGQIGYTTYAGIKGGFKTKLCYITTAVCQSLNLDDNCKELLLLKDYRDNIFVNQENGAEYINEYYNIAPTIVKRINKSENADEVYASLYNDHISKCIEDIENKQYEACKDRYIAMVNELKAKYMG